MLTLIWVFVANPHIRVESEQNNVSYRVTSSPAVCVRGGVAWGPRRSKPILSEVAQSCYTRRAMKSIVPHRTSSSLSVLVW